MTCNEVKQYLRHAVVSDHVAGSYLIHGGNADMRLEAAIYFSRILQCESPDRQPCGTCSACRATTRQAHPDVIFVAPERDEKGHEKRFLGIDDIRHVKESISLRPYTGKRKIYIFGDHPLREEAANAFLKMLEEPPDYAVLLILRTALHSLLPTIISRCQCLRLNFHLPEVTGEYAEITHTCTRLQSFLDEGKIESFFKGVDTICKEIDRESFDLWMERLAWCWRDAVLSHSGIPTDLLVNSNACGILPGGISSEDVDTAIAIREKNRFNINVRLALEYLILRIGRSGGTGRRARFRT